MATRDESELIYILWNSSWHSNANGAGIQLTKNFDSVPCGGGTPSMKKWLSLRNHHRLKCQETFTKWQSTAVTQVWGRLSLLRLISPAIFHKALFFNMHAFGPIRGEQVEVKVCPYDKRCRSRAKRLIPLKGSASILCLLAAAFELIIASSSVRWYALALAWSI